MKTRNQWQILTTLPNGDEISTVELPKYSQSAYTYPYETCVFKRNGTSDVVAMHDTQLDAVKKHCFLVQHELMHQLLEKESANG